MSEKAEIISPGDIPRLILTLRDQRVILDRDLAAIYGVDTRVLNQAVKRNLERFPGEFVFGLAPQELTLLRSQNVISS
jgi:ORF6N domain-containing protein